MKKIILFLITITTFTNVSYASFPVVEKVSNQTTGSNGPLFEMEGNTLIIWIIVVFILFVFTLLNFRKYWKSKYRLPFIIWASVITALGIYFLANLALYIFGPLIITYLIYPLFME